MLEAQAELTNGFYAAQKRRSTDFEALKWENVGSGPGMLLREITNCSGKVFLSSSLQLFEHNGWYAELLMG